jgi:hypothetical protein
MKAIGKSKQVYVSDIFPIQNGLKQGNALPPLLFIFALEYARSGWSRKTNRTGTEGTHQLLLQDDDNLFSRNVNVCPYIVTRLQES